MKTPFFKKKLFFRIFLFSFSRLFLLFEFISVLFYRIFFFQKNRLVGANKYKNFIIDTKKIHINRKINGISGFYRVKNEELLLSASIESHLPYLDEIIIVYNDSVDKTAEIAHAYARKYPTKIKVFEYVPRVSPAFSKEHIYTHPKSPYSLVNYYNFALSKTTKKNVLKIDADHIAIKRQFKNATNFIRQNEIKTMHYFFGINLHLFNSSFYINKRVPFTSGEDHGFFPGTNNYYFVHRKKWEIIKTPLISKIKKITMGPMYYHLRGVKNHRLNKNELLAWEEGLKKYSFLKDIVNPNIAINHHSFFENNK